LRGNACAKERFRQRLFGRKANDTSRDHESSIRLLRGEPFASRFQDERGAMMVIASSIETAGMIELVRLAHLSSPSLAVHSVIFTKPVNELRRLRHGVLLTLISGRRSSFPQL